jgi:hypothetical protein
MEADHLKLCKLIFHLPMIEGGGGALPARMDPGPTFPVKHRKFISISLISFPRLRLTEVGSSKILDLEEVLLGMNHGGDEERAWARCFA